MLWVLVIIVLGGARGNTPAIDHISFSSEVYCKKAIAQIRANQDYSADSITAYCIKTY